MQGFFEDDLTEKCREYRNQATLVDRRVIAAAARGGNDLRDKL